MAVTFQFPADLEKRLRSEMADLDAEAREASALELFRRGKLSHFELSQVLGLDRFETDAHLIKHNVYEGSLSEADLDADRLALERVLGPLKN
jgi:predicted HTH domain antitoxin